MSILTKVLGTKNDRELKRTGKVVTLINALEPEISALGDEELRGRTEMFRSRLEQG